MRIGIRGRGVVVRGLCCESGRGGYVTRVCVKVVTASSENTASCQRDYFEADGSLWSGGLVNAAHTELEN
jgi:hypothetical protein